MFRDAETHTEKGKAVGVNAHIDPNRQGRKSYSPTLDSDQTDTQQSTLSLLHVGLWVCIEHPLIWALSSRV